MDYYKVLGIPYGSSKEVIKKAFRELSKKYHPDKTTGDAEKYKQITQAYSELLKQPESAGYSGGMDYGNMEDIFNNGESFQDFINKSFGKSNPFTDFNRQYEQRTYKKNQSDFAKRQKYNIKIQELKSEIAYYEGLLRQL